MISEICTRHDLSEFSVFNLQLNLKEGSCLVTIKAILYTIIHIHVVRYKFLNIVYVLNSRFYFKFQSFYHKNFHIFPEAEQKVPLRWKSCNEILLSPHPHLVLVIPELSILIYCLIAFQSKVFITLLQVIAGAPLLQSIACAPWSKHSI